MRPNQKLYVISRRDLSPGAQACQGMHALTEFFNYFPNESKNWYTQSNHICFLSVDTEEALKLLLNRAEAMQIQFSWFCEPDFDNQLTAAVLEATDEASELVKELTLALR